MTVLLLIVDFAVVLVLTVFLMLVIRGLAQAVKARLKRGFADSIAAYDDLIEAKSRELRELEERVNLPEVPIEAPSVGLLERTAPDPLPSTPFAHGTFAQSYRLVRDTFSFKPVEAVHEALRHAPASAPERTSRCAAARELRAMFDHDTLFELISLAPDRQLTVLRDVLGGAQRALLDEFCSERRWTGALDLTHWLDAAILESSDEVVVTVGEHERVDPTSFGTDRPVRVRTSPDVCEGVLVRVGGTLYDYALRSKDLQ